MKVLKCLSWLRYICPGCFLGGSQKQFEADSPTKKGGRATSALYGVADGGNVENKTGG